jgi:PD-(D/E)XK endonuclease
MIAADLIRRGYKIAIPYGEDWDFDLIVCRDERLERVQCKYTRSNGEFIVLRARSQSLTNGRVRAVKLYTASMIEWLAVYDATSDRCYYVPASELGDGMNTMHLRLVAARNNQSRRVRPAGAYLEI